MEKCDTRFSYAGFIQLHIETGDTKRKLKEVEKELLSSIREDLFNGLPDVYI